ncbi:hypothetical protein A3715_10645 [Oleiphilus sp. HI0009]|nr:hypothetical protein A3715_10645 [Oleiphilus sp. HI0009]
MNQEQNDIRLKWKCAIGEHDWKTDGNKRFRECKRCGKYQEWGCEGDRNIWITKDKKSNLA